jgi:hypothetical protein
MTARDAPAANDNAYATGRPVVRVPRGRAEATYARSENVILPLRFARRMTGWQTGAGSSRRRS